MRTASIMSSTTGRVSSRAASERTASAKWASMTAAGSATVRTVITDVWDKGKAAVIWQEGVATDDATGNALWRVRSSIFVKGEGGWGGDRGTSTAVEVPDRPADLTTTYDVAPTQAFTWPELWRTRTLYGLLLIRFVSDPVWYFCLFWLPGYLQEQSGLTLAQVGRAGWIPYLAADLGGVATAAWSDWLVRRGTDPLRARMLMLTAVACAAPVCALTPHLPSPVATLAIFSVVGIICLSWLFSLSVVIAEAFPTRNVASVLGIAGGCGAAGAVVFNTFVGSMMTSFGPARVFAAMALLHPLATLVLWTMTRRERPPSLSR